MKIENLKQLQRLIKLCRTTGVEAIEVDGIKMNLGPTPMIVTHKKQKASTNDVYKQPLSPGGITEDTRIPTDGLTEEQLLMWSVQGHETPIESQ